MIINEMLPKLDRLAQVMRNFEQQTNLTRVFGQVTEVSQSHFRAGGLSKFIKLGDCVRIHHSSGSSLAQIVRIDQAGVLGKPFDRTAGVGLGARVERIGPLTIAPDPSWVGRIIDALAQPADGGPPLARGASECRVDKRPPNALQRLKVDRPIKTGVCAIDAFTPICAGQRIGVFAGSGVGKSTLLSMMTRTEQFSVAVVCLVGERGREARELVETLRTIRIAPTVVVLATGDDSPMMRRLAPLTATTIAEHFRDRGESVVLVVDSVTRYAHALREVAMAAGEPPVANGYTPSNFADLPSLLERAGPGVRNGGSITGIYAVLVDGDDHNEPIADCIRGTLDGHLVLDRAIAEQGRYPAINLLKSISRLSDRAWTNDERELVLALRTLIFRYEETRDLRMLGGYNAGTDDLLDRAIVAVPEIYRRLCQAPQEAPRNEGLLELSQFVRPTESRQSIDIPRAR